MMDKEIFDKYINLDQSCLHKEEKKEVIDMLYRYREVFSLRDEIGTCPNIEVQIDVTDKSPFLYGHIMLRKKIRHLLIKNEVVMLYGNIKSRILSIF